MSPFILVHTGDQTQILGHAKQEIYHVLFHRATSPAHVSHVKHGTYMKSYRMSLMETGFFTQHKPLETRYPVYLMPLSSMSSVCVDHDPGFDLD